MELQKPFLMFIIPYIFGLAILEIVWFYKTKRKYAWNEALASLMVFAIRRAFIVGLNAKIVFWIGDKIAPYQLFDLPVYQDGTWFITNAVLLFFAIEFFYYWFHRWTHEIRLFWASHSVHHSPNKMNLFTAERLAWTGGLFNGLVVFAPILILGFETKTVLVASTLNLLYQFWLHTEMIGNLGWFEKVFNTPSHHRVHHASNPRYLDANYGGVTIIFDRLFGTHIKETSEEKIVYGLVTPLFSVNPFKIAFNEWMGVLKDAKAFYNKPSILLGYLFGKPGWSHDGSRKDSKKLRKEYFSSRANKAKE